MHSVSGPGPPSIFANHKPDDPLGYAKDSLSPLLDSSYANWFVMFDEF
jgi:hypothetical protein